MSGLFVSIRQQAVRLYVPHSLNLTGHGEDLFSLTHKRQQKKYTQVISPFCLLNYCCYTEMCTTEVV